MSDIAIQVEGLSKLYHIGKRQTYKTARESLTNVLTAPARWLKNLGRPQQDDPATDLWALKDISFEVKRGEVVGIIGRNGAGKSTLLKVLSRITEPTAGRIRIHGRVGSLLEVGTGFHPELTGRENIFLNGAILGMHRPEIAVKFDEIVAFSEIDKFIDTPVKYYSSGMYMRLAFAVAAHLEPEILVVDEVLAVGDAEFQKKCLGKMKDVAVSGRTVLFVSHNMSAIQTLCNSAILLHAGQLDTAGDLPSVITKYLARGNVGRDISLAERNDRTGSQRARCVQAVIISEKLQRAANTVATSEAFRIEMTIEAKQPIRDAFAAVGIDSSDGVRLLTLFGQFTHNPLQLHSGMNKVVCHVQGLPLRPGLYRINTFVGDHHESYDHIVNAIEMEIIDEPYYKSGRFPTREQGPLVIEHHWATIS